MSELHEKLDRIQAELQNLTSILQKIAARAAMLPDVFSIIEVSSQQLPEEQKKPVPFERFAEDFSAIDEDWLQLIGAENKEDKRQYDLTSKYSVCRVSTTMFSVYTRACITDGYAYVSLINVSSRKDLVSLLLKLQVTHEDFLGAPV